MATFNSLNELEAYLNGKIGKALSGEVSTVARETMSDHVMSDVYSKYQPSEYQRTGNLYKDISTRMIDNNTLEVQDVAQDEETGRQYAAVVEYGQGYTWQDSRIYQMQPFPRPFVENTAKELADGKAKNALADGLRKQGIDVK